MSSWDNFIATAVFYTLCWCYTQCKSSFEHGLRHKARLPRETDHTLRITIDTKMFWTPGQNIFLPFMVCGLHMFTVHPFTICSVPQPGQQNTLVGPGAPGWAIWWSSTTSFHCVVERSIIIGGVAGAGPTLAMIEEHMQCAAPGWGRDGDGMGKLTSTIKVIVSTRVAGTQRWFVEALKEIMAKYSQAATAVSMEVYIHETGNLGEKADDG
ncbi:hypothetical protein BDV29DRAFT_158623 [Aspergillus leporis]|uniref:Uncharacterized protein n=1 Tax=Aspergillus leporis TaxID=41062 RepID=A0A5N5WZ56_9EURO|nr:hypothetical protein BDV29DRAFT_158623 [Aspergillus leporis]